FATFPERGEGELSKLRAHLVSTRHLVRVAKEINLGDFLRLGRGEELSGGRAKTALLVDALEAVLAAMHLDGGSEAARNFILRRVVEPELEQLKCAGDEEFAVTDFKSALQESVQALGRPQPAYSVAKESGPDHKKIFTVELRQQKTSAITSSLSLAQWLSMTVVMALFYITFLTQAFQIPSESMEKTLLIGDYLLVDKVHYSNGGAWGKLLPYGEIGRGDIIVFRYPLNPAQHFVKRVIGLPGDRVRMASKRVWLNGQLLDDHGYAVHQSNYVYFRDNFPQRAGVTPGQIDA